MEKSSLGTLSLYLNSFKTELRGNQISGNNKHSAPCAAPDISFGVIRGGVNFSSDGSPSAFVHCAFISPVPGYKPMFLLIIMQEVEMGRDEGKGFSFRRFFQCYGAPAPRHVKG